MSRLARRIAALSGGLLVGLLLGHLGSADLEEQERIERQYCEDVAAGVYDRDWKGLCAPEQKQ